MTPQRQKADWKDQLRQVKVSNNITELRNEKEIVRAIKYIEAELKTHAQLGTTGTESNALIFEDLSKIIQSIGLGQTNAELSLVIDQFLATLHELDCASSDLLSGAEEQVRELEVEIEKLQEKTGGTPVISVKDIEKELERRTQEKEKISPIIDGLYLQREDLEKQIRELEQLLQHGSPKDPSVTKDKKTPLERKLAILNNTLTSVEETMIRNDEEEATLISYRDAIKLVGNGLPAGIIGKKIDY